MAFDKDRGGGLKLKKLPGGDSASYTSLEKREKVKNVDVEGSLQKINAALEADDREREARERRERQAEQERQRNRLDACRC